MKQSIQRVGIVGCGLMGAGIAEVCARSGYIMIAREANRELMGVGIAPQERVFMHVSPTKGACPAGGLEGATRSHDKPILRPAEVAP